jgi:hypothetical protein
MCDVAVHQLNIVKPQGEDPSATMIYVHPRQIDAYGARQRMHRRERDQVACSCTTDFEHP